MKLSWVFLGFFHNKECRVRAASSDVVLFKDDDSVDTMVCQLNLYVFCDRKQDDGHRVHGAPILVVEIWSDSNSAEYIIGKVVKYKLTGIKRALGNLSV